MCRQQQQHQQPRAISIRAAQQQQRIASRAHQQIVHTRDDYEMPIVVWWFARALRARRWNRQFIYVSALLNVYVCVCLKSECVPFECEITLLRVSVCSVCVCLRECGHCAAAAIQCNRVPWLLAWREFDKSTSSCSTRTSFDLWPRGGSARADCNSRRHRRTAREWDDTFPSLLYRQTRLALFVLARSIMWKRFRIYLCQCVYVFCLHERRFSFSTLHVSAEHPQPSPFCHIYIYIYIFIDRMMADGMPCVAAAAPPHLKTICKWKRLARAPFVYRFQ